LTYTQYQIPLVISQITPVALLLSVLVVFGLMNKNNELIALRSSGVSSFYLLKPVVGLTTLIAVGLFFLSDVVVPISANKANRILFEEVKKKAVATSRNKNIWIKGNRSLAHIRYFNPNNRTISGVTLYYFDDAFNLVRRVDAARGEYKDNRWTFHDLMEQNYANRADRTEYDIQHYDSRVESLDYLPDELKQVAKKSEEMNFIELLEYIRRVEAEGYDATKYRVDLHAKIAFPLVCIIMGLIASGFSFRRRMREGIAISIAYGIGVIFLYWSLHSFSISLGYGEILPPIVAAWLANVVFSVFVVITLKRIRH
jgi:lipopolysaccharide export system permease protein